MTKCGDIVSFIEKIAPPELAEEWDNVGLLVGSGGISVERVLVCLDVTHAVVEECIERKANLIVAHHPVIFDGIKRLNEADFKGRLLYSLVRKGINVYTAHTNLDYAKEGVNKRLAASLGLKNTEIMGKGPGIFGTLEREYGLSEFVDIVKASLNVHYVRVAGNADRGLKKAAVFSGSFDKLEEFIATGADVLVTGDLKYHDAVDASEAGCCIIDAGHFNTEAVVLPSLAKALRDEFADIEVFCSVSGKDPFITY